MQSDFEEVTDAHFVSTAQKKYRVKGAHTISITGSPELVLEDTLGKGMYQIKKCPKVLFCGQVRLDSLRLCKVTCVIPQHSIFLQTLSLKRCGLTGDIDFGLLRIKYLNLKGNCLDSIDVSGCQKLITLVLSPTNIEKIARTRSEMENQGLPSEIRCDSSRSNFQALGTTTIVYVHPDSNFKIKLVEYI